MVGKPQVIDTTGYGARIAQIILDLSAKRGERLTLEQVGRIVADVVGRDDPYSSSTVFGWTKEKNEPPLAVFMALARLSGHKAGWIAFGENHEVREKPKTTQPRGPGPNAVFDPPSKPAAVVVPPRKRRA